MAVVSALLHGNTAYSKWHWFDVSVGDAACALRVRRVPGRMGLIALATSPHRLMLGSYGTLEANNQLGFCWNLEDEADDITGEGEYLACGAQFDCLPDGTISPVHAPHLALGCGALANSDDALGSPINVPRASELTPFLGFGYPEYSRKTLP